MKRDNGKNRRSGTGITKAKIALTVGYTAASLLSECLLIYREKQGDLAAAFPESESEINKAIEKVKSEKEKNV